MRRAGGRRRASEPEVGRRGEQVEGVGALDADLDQVAGLQGVAGDHMHLAVDLGRVGVAAGQRHPVGAHGVDQHVHGLADAGLQLGAADARGGGHEALAAALLDLFGHMTRQGVGGGALDVLVGEGAHAIELGLLQPLQQEVEIGLGLAGKPTTKVERSTMFGTMERQAAIRSSVFSWLPGRFIAFSTLGEACWNGMSR